MNSLFRIGAVVLCCSLCSKTTYAQDEDDRPLTPEDEIAIQAIYDSIEATITFIDEGTISLADGIAEIVIPEGYKYLDAKQSAYVLTDLWGNAPAPTLGMLFLEDSGVFGSDDSYVIDISYDDMGYVADDDAADIDYDDLLESMKDDIIAGNEQREAMGYSTFELVNWASTPYYDHEAKKLHWAKELSFDGSEDHTLNYAIRVLGRKGVLEMNFISDMAQLAHVQRDLPKILPSVHFKPGNTYAEFDSNFDQVAAVGIGGLIAGKVLAKAGFFAVLAKFGKVIFLAIAGFFGYLFKRKGKDTPSTDEA